jgi:POT family proton-dependent oligopeptide transporter
VDDGAPRSLGRETVLVLVGIGLAVTVFRAAYEQVGNTVALWADSGVDRTLGDWSIPMTWFQSLNPLFVMLLTPPLLAYWHRRAAARGLSHLQTKPLQYCPQYCTICNNSEQY